MRLGTPLGPVVLGDPGKARKSTESHVPVGFRGLGGLRRTVGAKLEVDVVKTCSVDPGPRQYHAAPRRVLEP